MGGIGNRVEMSFLGGNEFRAAMRSIDEACDRIAMNGIEVEVPEVVEDYLQDNQESGETYWAMNLNFKLNHAWTRKVLSESKNERKVLRQGSTECHGTNLAEIFIFKFRSEVWKFLARVGHGFLNIFKTMPSGLRPIVLVCGSRTWGITSYQML